MCGTWPLCSRCCICDEQVFACVSNLLLFVVLASTSQALENSDFAETDIPFNFNIPQRPYASEANREDVSGLCLYSFMPFCLYSSVPLWSPVAPQKEQLVCDEGVSMIQAIINSIYPVLYPGPAAVASCMHHLLPVLTAHKVVLIPLLRTLVKHSSLQMSLVLLESTYTTPHTPTPSSTPCADPQLCAGGVHGSKHGPDAEREGLRQLWGSNV